MESADGRVIRQYTPRAPRFSLPHAANVEDFSGAGREAGPVVDRVDAGIQPNGGATSALVAYRAMTFFRNPSKSATSFSFDGETNKTP